MVSLGLQGRLGPAGKAFAPLLVMQGGLVLRKALELVLGVQAGQLPSLRLAVGLQGFQVKLVRSGDGVPGQSASGLWASAVFGLGTRGRQAAVPCAGRAAVPHQFEARRWGGRSPAGCGRQRAVWRAHRQDNGDCTRLGVGLRGHAGVAWGSWGRSTFAPGWWVARGVTTGQLLLGARGTQWGMGRPGQERRGVPGVLGCLKIGFGGGDCAR
jgi:hypothetical protein